MASAVADTAFEAYRDIEYHDWVPLAMREQEIELGVRLPSEAEVVQAKQILEDAGPSCRCCHHRSTLARRFSWPSTRRRSRSRLQAIRIGQLGIVSSPCETFVETGLAIKQASPLKPTFVIELANGYNGYLPTPEQHRLGGYETWRARSSYLEVDAATKIQRTLLELLEQVAVDDH